MSREIENKEPTMTEFENKRVFREQVRAEIRTVVGNYHEKSAFGAMEDAIVALLTSHARPAEEDTKLLNWLDSKTTGYGDGIAFRMSVKGRGWRLYEALLEKAPCECVPKPTVREAIRVAMEAEATPAAAQAERGEG